MWRIIFLPFLITLALLEGLGIPNGREVTFYLILVMPFFLLFLDLIERRPILVPIKLSFLFGLFFILAIISTYLSLDHLRSIPYLTFYLTLFLTFIWVFNHQAEVKRGVLWLIFSLSTVFSLYPLWPIFIPEHGYQFVFSKFGSHNHLGDFLVLPLVYGVYKFMESGKKIYLLTLIFMPLFLTSFSRSAYLTLLVSLVAIVVYFIKSKRLRISSWPFLIVSTLAILATFFLFSTVWEAKQVPVLKSTNQFLKDYADLEEKFFLGNRLAFGRETILSFGDSPLFGIGPNNFVYVSQKYTQTGRWAYSSHNIFLDILVENGILALMVFVVIIGLVLVKAFVNPTVYSFLALSMLINFQTDYTHTIYSFFLLFFILMGLIYKEEKQVKSNWPFVLSFLVLIFASLWILSF